MNELAEIIGQLEFSEENRKKSCGAYSNPILRKSETEAIIKALRFAADMERLMPHMPGFWIEKGVCRCAFDAVAGDASVRTIVNGADYYSAARKAVDALEKGESDGK